jgi:hypothetical protein
VSVVTINGQIYRTGAEKLHPYARHIIATNVIETLSDPTSLVLSKLAEVLRIQITGEPRGETLLLPVSKTTFDCLSCLSPLILELRHVATEVSIGGNDLRRRLADRTDNSLYVVSVRRELGDTGRGESDDGATNLERARNGDWNSGLRTNEAVGLTKDALEELELLRSVGLIDLLEAEEAVRAWDLSIESHDVLFELSDGDLAANVGRYDSEITTEHYNLLDSVRHTSDPSPRMSAIDAK